jgi:hypothetical protein
MPAIKIRAAGAKSAPAAKPKPKAKAKPGAKATTRPTTRGRRGASAKPSAKPKPAAKRGPGRPRKTEAEAAEGTKRNVTGLAKSDPKLEAKLLKAVKAAGDRRREAKIEHEESVNALYEAAKEALEAGVSMAKVSDSCDISRQWLYKMGEFAGREGGNGGNGASTSKAAPKPAPKRANARKGRTSTKRGTATKSAGAKPRTRTRIRAAA